MTQSLNLQVLEFWEHLDSILYFEWHWQDKKVVITITFLGSNRQLVGQSIIGFLFFVWSLTLLNVYCNHFSKNNKLIVTCTVTRTISNFQCHVNINNNWLTVSLLIIIGIFASLPMCFSLCTLSKSVFSYYICWQRGTAHIRQLVLQQLINILCLAGP